MKNNVVQFRRPTNMLRFRTPGFHPVSRAVDELRGELERCASETLLHSTQTAALACLDDQNIEEPQQAEEGLVLALFQDIVGAMESLATPRKPTRVAYAGPRVGDSDEVWLEYGGCVVWPLLDEPGLFHVVSHTEHAKDVTVDPPSIVWYGPKA